MAKKMYVGVSGVARKVKKIYVGVSGKARKVKKGYIGVGGKARLFFSGGELAYYGTITSLYHEIEYHAAASTGNYALFGGGYYSNSARNYVDAYNESLTKSNPTSLSTSRYYFSGTSIGDYALFGPGERSSSSESRYVDAYNKSLTRTYTSYSDTAADPGSKFPATSLGEYAFFCKQGAGSVLTTSLTATRLTEKLTNSPISLAATSTTNNALFGGGGSISTNGVVANVANVGAYDSSLTKSDATSLSTARRFLAATSVGGYALFAGGIASTGHSSKVDSYSPSLTKGVPTKLSVARCYLTGVNIGDYAIFAGGMTGAGVDGLSPTVDVYDTSLTRTIMTSLSAKRHSIESTTVGNYALFGGGMGVSSNGNYTSLSAAVEAYVVG